MVCPNLNKVLDKVGADLLNEVPLTEFERNIVSVHLLTNKKRLTFYALKVPLRWLANFRRLYKCTFGFTSSLCVHSVFFEYCH